MAETLIQLTGGFNLPNGDTPRHGRFTLWFSGWSKSGGDVFVPGPVEGILTSTGQLDNFFAQSTTVLDAYVLAHGSVKYYSDAVGEIVTVDFPPVAIPAVGPVSYASLLAIPAPEPTVPDALAQALAAQAAANASAGNAAASAAAALASAVTAQSYAVYPFASRAAAAAATIPAGVKTIAVLHNGVQLDYAEDATGTALTTVGGQKWSPRGQATPGHWGAVGSGTETTLLQAFATYCAAKGQAAIFPAGTWTFTSVDFAGANITSNAGAVLVGTPVNAGRISGVVLGGVSTDATYQGAFNPPEMSGGFVVQYRDLATDGDNGYYVYTKTAVGDYLSVRMRDRVGADGPNWELIRQQSVFSAVLALAYKTVIGATYTGAGWSDYQYTASVLSLGSGVTSGAENAFLVGRRTNGSGNSVSMTVQPDVDGIVTVSFSARTTASNNVTIAWPGGSRVISTLSPVVTIQTVRIDSGQVAPFTLTITNNTASFMNLMAINMDVPGALRRGVIYDSWAHYLGPTTDHYITSNGAAEYAFRIGTGAFAGSYHGSETAIDAPKWLFDGTERTLTKNVPMVGFGSIRLVQKTLIGAGLNDGTGVIAGITSRTSHLFTDGAITMDLSLTGSLKSSTVYMGMCMPQWTNGANLNFNEVIAPRYVDLPAVGEYAVGNTDTVIWENRRTGHRVTAHCRMQTGFAAMKGGVSVDVASGSTSYAKARWSLQGDALDTFNGASARFVQVFE